MGTLHIELNDEQHKDLVDLLECDLSDLRMEIADTDSADFKKHLNARKEVIGKVLDALRGTPHEAQA